MLKELENIATSPDKGAPVQKVGDWDVREEGQRGSKEAQQLCSYPDFTPCGATDRIIAGDNSRIPPWASKGVSDVPFPTDDVPIPNMLDQGQGSGVTKDAELPEVGPKGTRPKLKLGLSATFRYRQPTMSYTHMDGFKMRDLLVNHFDFRKENIHLMMDDGEFWNQTKKSHSAYEVTNELGFLAGQMKEDGDVLVFYYSGHGSRENGKSYIVASDGSLMNIEVFKEAIQEVPPHCSVYIIIDCCYGGGLREICAPNVVLIEGSQESEEGWSGSDGSNFTSHFCNILTEDANKPPEVIVDEVNQRFNKGGYGQRASLFCSKKRSKLKMFE